MNALGRGTDIHHIEALRGKDDGFEWFGGNNFIHHVRVGGEQRRQPGHAARHAGWWSVRPRASSTRTPPPATTAATASRRQQRERLRPAPPLEPEVLQRDGRRLQSAVRQRDGDRATARCCRRGTAGQIANTIITDWSTSAVKINDNATLAHGVLRRCPHRHAQHPEQHPVRQHRALLGPARRQTAAPRLLRSGSSA